VDPYLLPDPGALIASCARILAAGGIATLLAWYWKWTLLLTLPVIALLLWIMAAPLVPTVPPAFPPSARQALIEARWIVGATALISIGMPLLAFCRPRPHIAV
jgi:hypothetical protein